MEPVFNLSNLIKFFHKTLILTADIKNALRSNCDEALFCLKPWCIEVISQQEINSVACTCHKAESEVAQIAADINRALLQTQQLREKLSLNVVTEKKLNRSRIHEYVHTNDSKKEIMVKAVGTKNKNSKQDCESVKTNKQKLNSNVHFQDELTKHLDVKCIEAQKHNKQAIDLPSISRENKNFVIINKKCIKNMMRSNQQKGSNEFENKSKSKSTIEPKCVKIAKCTTASTNELKQLIQKFSNESNDATTTKQYHMECPLHGDSSPMCTHKYNSLSMNIIDSLSVVHIPGEIVKSLKVYHAYLNIEHSVKLAKEMQQKELHKFLTEFNKMDNLQQKMVMKNCNMSTLHKFVSLCQPLFSKHLNLPQLIDIKVMYAELNPTCTIYGIEKLTGRQILKSNETLLLDSMMNGIWNDLWNDFNTLDGTSNVCCTRYKKKEHLLLFYNRMQILLQTEYHIKLIKITEKYLLPYMQKSFDTTQSEYAQIYKMLSVLYQGLKSHIPILVKTDKQ